MLTAHACLPRRVVAALVMTSVLLIGGCPPQLGGNARPSVPPGLRAEYVVSDAAWPSALAAAEDGRLFYGEKNTGQIRVIKDEVRLDKPFASVPVNFAGDRGLLGIAVHPAFATNGRIYVFYTRSDTGESTDDPRAVVDHRVVYFELSDPSADVSTGAEVFVASLPMSSSLTRISGRIAFAPDRTLLVALGDLEHPDAAQDPARPLGKILRYHDDGTIPADNPFPDSAVYAIGFCEPRGLTIDPESGAPFLTERSADTFNEINRIQRGGNYGWPQVVGWADTPDELNFVAAHPHYADALAQSSRAYIGAAFNPSGKYGQNRRLRFFYGLTDQPVVYSLGLSVGRTAVLDDAQIFAANLPSTITDIAFTRAGTLYIACQTAVLRIVPR